MCGTAHIFHCASWTSASVHAPARHHHPCHRSGYALNLLMPGMKCKSPITTTTHIAGKAAPRRAPTYPGMHLDGASGTLAGPRGLIIRRRLNSRRITAGADVTDAPLFDHFEFTPSSTMFHDGTVDRRVASAEEARATETGGARRNTVAQAGGGRGIFAELSWHKRCILIRDVRRRFGMIRMTTLRYDRTRT